MNIVIMRELCLLTINHCKIYRDHLDFSLTGISKKSNSLARYWAQFASTPDPFLCIYLKYTCICVELVW